uniref:Secreted protein n=1 Tax=Solanum tuberosum TaxID=4113 RepID=M1BK73_SOLTU
MGSCVFSIVSHQHLLLALIVLVFSLTRVSAFLYCSPRTPMLQSSVKFVFKIGASRMTTVAESYEQVIGITMKIYTPFKYWLRNEKLS